MYKRVALVISMVLASQITLGAHRPLDESAQGINQSQNGHMVRDQHGRTTLLFGFKVVRLDEKGKLDSSFAEKGILEVKKLHPLEAFENYSSIFRQEDGKLLLLGVQHPPYSRYYTLILRRLRENGSVDHSFGNDGKLLFDLGRPNTSSRSLLRTADGQWRLAGKTGFYPGHPKFHFNFAIMGLNSHFKRDSHFGHKGTTYLGDTLDDYYKAVIQKDGKILLIVRKNAATGFETIRLTAKGDLDTSFGDKGYVTTSFQGNSGLARTLALQSDGKILVAGATDTGGSPSNQFALVRYDRHGALDEGFATNGFVYRHLPDWVHKIAVSEVHGRIVLAAAQFGNGAGHSHSVLYRFHPSGSVDESFGVNGALTLNQVPSAVSDFVPDSQKRLLVFAPSLSQLVMFRLLADGQFDPSYGEGGMIVHSLSMLP